MWYEIHDNLLALAIWLKREGEWDGAGGVGNLLYYFQKPWKYDDEWRTYQEHLKKEVKNAQKTR
jgi:hypothetical protein